MTWLQKHWTSVEKDGEAGPDGSLMGSGLGGRDQGWGYGIWEANGAWLESLGMWLVQEEAKSFRRWEAKGVWPGEQRLASEEE